MAAARERRGGMTLVEVLLAVVILSSGAVLVVNAFAKIWESVRVAQHRSAAHIFAVSKMADLELANRQGLPLLRRPGGTFRAEGQKFTWDVSAVPSDPDRLEAPTLVTLTVTWPRGGRTDSLTYETLLRAPAAAQTP
jgi:prepilin-type N-terminal cleavage/methylation domain-containing protein